MLAELAAAVREKRIDPLDLVDESLRRIEAANPTLNAVTDVYAEDARAQARSHSREGALAGLPVLVKDLARVRGKRTTLGSPLYADAPPDEVDDVVVARLRDAGAIIIGRSNTPAFGHAPFTTNKVFGATRNPWNPERSPGGSSGGSAAALAAALVPLATSSDGGGSVRIPASCCGLVGYKPSMGAIGRNVLPRWIGFSTMGATGRTVADVVLEASVILGPARGDFLSLPRAGVALEPQHPARVLACRTFRSGVDPVIEAAFDDAVETIARAGVPVTRVDAPSGSDVAAAWFTIAAAELAESLAHVREQWDGFEESLRGMLHFGEHVTTAQYIAATRLRHTVSARFDDLLGDDAVLVTPLANVQSWPPDGPLPSTADDPAVALNTPDINFTGHPAVSVPLGRDDAGVPFGLQVVAPRFSDGFALGLAELLERERPWPTVAPGYEPYPT